MIRRSRTIIALFLVALFCVTTGNFAIAGVGAELQHQVSHSEPHTPPQGGDAKACDHCCACHYSSHLSSATTAASSAEIPSAVHGVAPWRGTVLPPRPSEAFFRPPRIS